MEIKHYPLTAKLPPLPHGYPISAKVVCDSINDRGTRLTTLELVFPRYILAEFNTHRVFSRNAGSSRAIPTSKLIESSRTNFVEPIRYGKNKKGMQADLENLEGELKEEAAQIWREMSEVVIRGCARLAELGLHKQWACRPLEWFTSIRVIVTATEWDNFFLLRDHSEAQDEIIYLAQAIKLAMNGSVPIYRPPYGPLSWHIPYVSEVDFNELGLDNALKVSSARCARVSLKTHHGVTSTLEDDLRLFNTLVHNLDSPTDPFHASPTEHQAEAIKPECAELTSNLKNWTQFRKRLETK